MLVLASRSPQRAAILNQLNVRFSVRPADVDELGTGDPYAVAAENARRKVAATPARAGELVMGVDTLVHLGGEIFGKPLDREHAEDTVSRLAGRTHTVVSGLAFSDREAVLTAATTVTFRPLSAEQVAAYVATGEWQGRAGGYAIQGRGAALVERLDGDYSNVVGLPVAALVDALGELVLPDS